MNVEAGPSGAIGAPGVGAISTAGPSVGAGPSISAEIGTIGVGFDNGAPTFSGLERSDVNIPGFREFSASSASVKEGPVGKSVFNGTREFIASPSSVPEGPFPFQPKAESAPEGFVRDASRPGLAEDAMDVEPLFETQPQTEKSAETAVQEYFETHEAPSSEVNPQTFNQNVEDLKYNDPLTYKQLKSDLESVDKILDLVDEAELNKQTAASISNSAIETAVKRSGLIQSLEDQSDDSVRSESETETETINQVKIEEASTQDPILSEIEKNRLEIRPEQETKPKKPDADFYVDQRANSARLEDTNRAIELAFEEDADPVSGKVNGADVVAKLEPEPPSDEISEIVLRDGERSDGSELMRRNQIATEEFETPQDAIAANERSVVNNNAVTDQKAEKIATPAEVQKVKSGTNVNAEKQEIYPLAA